MSARCLNCDEPLGDAFCARCGQAANTERLTLGGLARDFARRVLYLDSQVFRTLAVLAVRPGHVVRDYVRGHRVRHFNPFALLVLLLLLDSTLRGYWGFHLSSDADDQATRQIISTVEDWRLHHAKLLILATLPLRAACSYAWFRRASQNFAEHVVIEAYAAVASFAVASVVDGLAALVGPTYGLPLVRVGVLLSSAYQFALYAQYFSVFGYSRPALLVRSLLAVLSVPVLVTAVLAVLLAL